MISLPLIGGHVSAAGGVHNAIANGERIGGTCIQIFGASPRQWFAKMPEKSDLQKYAAALEKSPIKAVFLHAAYLVNLATLDPAQFTKSVKSLTEHLRIADALGAQGLIFHLGAGKDLPASIKQTVKGMSMVLKNVPGKTQLIMENSAGGGTRLGSDLPHIGALLHSVSSPRVKVCIDTAHAFESGLIPAYSSAGVDAFCKEFDKEIGLSHLVALHVNDSKTPAHSHNDRHENIGEGMIGLPGFKNLAAVKSLRQAAWLLEVPGFDDSGPDKKNIDIVRRLFL